MTAIVDQIAEKDGTGLDLLDGIRVLDLTSSVAGPYGAQLLADMGAQVIKVERPASGDDCRAWGPPFIDEESLWFLSVNRNKLGITLDFTAAEGKAILHRLVADADIVIVSVPGRVQKKLGIDDASLRAVREDLIHVSITGFGLDGARADLACYDLIAEGYSGVMAMTGEPDSPPQKIGTPAADLLAGQDAAMSAVAAVVRRGRTGKGAKVDVSLVESMTRFMAPRLSPQLGSTEQFTRSGGRDSVIAVYQMFETADLPITLGLGNDGIWRRFWQAVGEPEFAERPGLSSNADRRAARAEIVARIASIVATRKRDEWLRIFAEHRIPAGPIYSLSEVAGDWQFQERGLIYTKERDGQKLPQIGLGIRFDGESEACHRPAPKLGGDNLAVYRQILGMSEAEVRKLESDKII